ETIRQGHVAVETVNEDGSLWRVLINQFFRRQFRIRPALVIPIAARDPSSFGKLCRKVANTLGKFLWRGCVAQVDARQLKTASHEVNVRVIETRQYELSLRIDHSCVCVGKVANFLRRTNRDITICQDRNGLSARLFW